MFKKFLLAFAGFAVVVIALGAVKVAQIKEMSSISHAQPPSAITTYEAKAVAWQPVLNAIGTLAPVQGLTVSADADGVISKIAVENGANSAPFHSLLTGIIRAGCTAAIKVAERI